MNKPTEVDIEALKSQLDDSREIYAEHPTLGRHELELKATSDALAQYSNMTPKQIAEAIIAGTDDGIEYYWKKRIGAAVTCRLAKILGMENGHHFEMVLKLFKLSNTARKNRQHEKSRALQFVAGMLLSEALSKLSIKDKIEIEKSSRKMIKDWHINNCRKSLG